MNTFPDRFQSASSVISAFLVACLVLLLPAIHSTYARQIDTPSQVELISPADGSVTYASAAQPKALPRFVWNQAAGAVSYRLEISASPTFDPDTLLVAVPGTAFPTWTPVDANLPDDVDLYWRVRVEEQTGTAEKGDYSPVWKFRKDWRRTGPEPGALNAANLLLPADGAVLAYTDPSGSAARPGFSWTPVMGATHYIFQLAQNPEFDPLYYTETTISISLQIARKLADGTYYWRVVPMQEGSPDLAGHPGSSRQVTFDYHAEYLPLLLKPADNSESALNPTFRWMAVRGAEKYLLQYSADPAFPAGQTSEVETIANSYTPPELLSNRSHYYWRVRVVSGNSNDPAWTPTFSFTRNWQLRPNLLTPTNGYPYVWDPYYSWTPVAGAVSYRIETDDDPSFSNPLTGTTSNNFFVFRDQSANCPNFLPVYWRVIPIDASGNEGEPSATWGFHCNQQAGAPVQVYPSMYFPPVTDLPLNPHEDNTVALPVFQWKRVLSGEDQTPSPAYRIQVSSSPGFEPTAIRYSFDTENMNAVPTSALSLPDGDGQTDYYWRVRPLTGINGSEIGQWSQEWRVRFQPNLLPPAITEIQTLRPIQGSEWVETIPLFEWARLQNATSYQVQISDNAAFDPPFGTYSVGYPAYSHPFRLPSGTYYWRVCGITSGNPQCDSNNPGEWSSPIRFQVAAQSRWRPSRALGSNHTPVIATDPAGDANNDYDLTNLSITQGGANWYIGFNANTGIDKKFVVYIDTDHVDNSGATQDPENYDITTITAHRPEYVIYIYQEGGNFGLATSRLYTWDKYREVWNTPKLFSHLNGANILYTATTSYLELVLPGSLIGQTDTVSSLAVSVISLGNSGGGPRDSVPSDPNVTSAGGGAQISRFACVTDRINLISPTSKTGNDPTIFTTVPAFYWQPLVEVPSTTHYELRIGLRMDAIDPNHMTMIIAEKLYNNPAVYTFTDDVEGDKPTYFWQVRPWYGASLNGGWSQVSRLQRKGNPVQGLTVNNEQWTPVFRWNLAEGGYDHHLQIDDDPAFNPPYIDSITTKMNSYTPASVTFEDGKPYYARVQLRRTATITNDFSDPVLFSVLRPAVTGLRTIPTASQASPAPYNPTFCWDPVLSAYTYLFEIFWDVTGQIPYFNDETEQSCYTVPDGMLDGEFYWRVALIDGSGKNGPPSEVREFWKIYPAPNPIYPMSVVDADGTPVFRWSGVNGADTYIIEIADKPDFSTIRYTGSTVNTEHLPTMPIATGYYYWRVKMVDRDGIEGPFSNSIYIGFKSYIPIIRR